MPICTVASPLLRVQDPIDTTSSMAMGPDLSQKVPLDQLEGLLPRLLP